MGNKGGANSKTHVDWSRQLEKKAMEIAGADPCQSNITEYFSVLDKLSQIIN